MSTGVLLPFRDKCRWCITAQQRQKCSASAAELRQGRRWIPTKLCCITRFHLQHHCPLIKTEQNNKNKTNPKKPKLKTWSPSSSFADCSGCFSCVTKQHLISALFRLKNNFPHRERFERCRFQARQLPYLIHCIATQTLILAQGN